MCDTKDAHVCVCVSVAARKNGVILVESVIIVGCFYFFVVAG